MLLIVEEMDVKQLNFYTAKAINLCLQKDVTNTSQCVYVDLNQYGGYGSKEWCPTAIWDDFGSLMSHFRPSINWNRDSCLVEIFEHNCLEGHKGKSLKSYITCHCDVRIALCKAVVGYCFGSSFNSESIK